MTEYYTSDSEHRMSKDEVSSADREIQLDVMETWFRQRFEDPAERTPFESAEGGYIWIWGGPYDARDELEMKFAGLVPDEVIEELAAHLGEECPEWTSAPSAEDYDDYLLGDIARITSYHQNFLDAIQDIKRLREAKVDDTVASCLWRLLYVNVITALETYLSDAFINTVANTPDLMRRVIETTPEFQAERVPRSQVYKEAEEIEERARSYLVDVVWHNLERVKPMYRATLGIEFPPDSGQVFRAILTRHDIVHRNGKTKTGEDILITPSDVADLISAVERFVQHIDRQLAGAMSESSQRKHP